MYLVDKCDNIFQLDSFKRGLMEQKDMLYFYYMLLLRLIKCLVFLDQLIQLIWNISAEANKLSVLKEYASTYLRRFESISKVNVQS